MQKKANRYFKIRSVFSVTRNIYMFTIFKTIKIFSIRKKRFTKKTDYQCTKAKTFIETLFFKQVRLFLWTEISSSRKKILQLALATSLKKVPFVSFFYFSKNSTDGMFNTPA